MQQTKMHRSTHLLVIFFFFLCCIVTFQHASALRRIKRGSLAAKSGPVPAKEPGHELHADTSHKDDSYNKAAAASMPEVTAVEGNGAEHAWSKKDAPPKTVIEKPISSFLFSKTNIDDKAESAGTSPVTRSAHAQLQYTNTAEIKPSFIAPLERPVSAHKDSTPLDSRAKELHKSPFTYWLDPRHSSWFDDAQLEKAFNGDGHDVLIIDNSLQPVVSERAAPNFHTPNLRSVAHSRKPLADSGEHSGSNNANDNSKQRNNHIENNNSHKDGNSNASHNNNNNSHNNNNNIGTHTKINDSVQNNVALNLSNRNVDRNTNNNNNKNNDGDNNNNPKRNNNGNAEKDNGSNDNSIVRRTDNDEHSADHQPAASAAGDNAISANNNFNPNVLNNDGVQQQQQQQQQKMSISPLLAVAGSVKEDNTNELAKPRERAAPASQLQRLQAAGAPLLQQHPKQEQQQQQQLQSHFNGKVLPIDSMLKFANMLLYKMDGAPIHAQRAEVSINSNPASVVSVGPSVENSDDIDTIDFFYNNLEPQVAPVIRFPQPLSIGGGTSTMLAGGASALAPHPFMLPPFNINEAPPPFNLLESALDLFLGGGEDDGEDQIELRCPIHHEPKKKAAEAAAGGAGNSSAEAASEGKDDVIQVCSCRFFKKKKSA